MEDAATIKTSRESTPILEPDPKRQRLERTDSGPFIVLDEDGDLRLCVGAAHIDQPSTFLVCSKALARSSPAMKRMILGGLAGSSSSQDPQGDWIIHLTGDEPAPMHLMLRIIHGDLRQVPRTMELQALHNIVVVMNKYDALSLTRPWVRSWLAGVETSGDCGRLLSIAWTLGDRELFKTTSARLIESSKINGEGYLIVNSDISASNHLGRNTEDILVNTTAQGVPESVFSNLEIMRAERISDEVAPYQKLYNDLRSGNWECRSPNHCREKRMSPRCRALALGSLVQGFLDMGINITRLNPTHAYRESVVSLLKGISELEILTDRNCKKFTHDGCTQMLNAMKHKQPPPFTYIEPKDISYLMFRAEKNGLLD